MVLGALFTVFVLSVGLLVFGGFVFVLIGSVWGSLLGSSMGLFFELWACIWVRCVSGVIAFTFPDYLG